MKIRYLIPVLIIMGSTVASAADFYIEEEALSLIPQAADSAIRKSEQEQQGWLKDCKFVGRPVDLGDSNSHLVITTKDGCGWGAALGPIWVVRKTGDIYAVVLSHGGYSLKTTEPKKMVC